MQPWDVINFLKLVRFDTSLLTACIIFVPYLYKGLTVLHAAQKALPILLTSMCCFVLNDIHDLEKDRINHPTRPLPTGSISERSAMGIYFLLLALTLSSILSFVEQDKYYIYLLCLIIFTNYDHVVSDFPYLKNFYVATASVLPILILRPSEFSFTIIDNVALAMMFFIFGRELLMDLQDLLGDGQTFVRSLGEKSSASIGFGSQFIAILLLAAIAEGAIHWAVIAFLFASYILHIFLWHRLKFRPVIIHAMKAQAIAGLAFLLQ
ncbi:UbiA family prenyltransferase [Roseibium sp. Sym1]|uniref:UbiA family prenyltransferase n=1 Tax=Roseibium sp. Sym1 TaxID=3016006 RepID=UPI0022B4D2E6|nr:UbiA family prenyltransferase [Roseibium sp. Sym1]